MFKAQKIEFFGLKIEEPISMEESTSINSQMKFADLLQLFIFYTTFINLIYIYIYINLN